MTEPDLTGHTDQCGAEVAAYALGTLEPAEAEAFRRHLETCVVCRDELASFQRVVDILPMSAPQHKAPRALRRRVLAEVNRDPAGRERRRRPWRLVPSLGIPRPVLALGALLAAAAIAAGGVELGSSRPARTEVFHAQVAGSPGSAEVQVTNGHAHLAVHDFTPPPAGQVYEIWLAGSNGTPRPAGALFSVSATGAASVAVPDSLRGIRRLMVTPEPAGGTSVPTHPAVITASLD